MRAVTPLIIGFAAVGLFTGPAWSETYTYVGSSTVGKFMADAMSVYGGSVFALETKSESSGGERCSVRDTCSLGGVAREVDPAYLRHGVVATLIGKDAIAAIVHRDNPVRALSSADLKGIFTGAITNWSEVGGADAPVRALMVKKGSATRTVFGAAVLDGADYGDIEVVTPDRNVVATVAADPNAIGQISFAFIQGVDDVAAVDVDGQQATVANSAYPITRPLYLTTNGTPAGEVQAFIDWALSDVGQAVVRQRFVGVK